MSGIVGDGSGYTCKHLMRVKEPKECVFCHRDQLQQENERLRAGLLGHACFCGSSDPEPNTHREDCPYRKWALPEQNDG